MTKSLVFDSGPVINIALNNLLWTLKPLKERFGGEFYITESVKRECVDRPLQSKRFKYEAIETLKVIQEGTIKVYTNRQLKSKTLALLDLCNNLFKVKGNYVKNIQYAEVESIAAAKLLEADAVVIDEFITRMVLEDPMFVKERMERKIHEIVTPDKNNLEILKAKVEGLKVIRSFELVTIAYELGIFKDYYLSIPEPKKNLLDGLLWTIKLNGCSVTEQEIEEVKKIEDV
ncbi:MAG: hypothetical protein NDI94_03010 [Candidatus Woesearchaeota archaeon]|nr:hypothetical protein [Candidatus Woesearchaeota archaeon]